MAGGWVFERSAGTVRPVEVAVRWSVERDGRSGVACAHANGVPDAAVHPVDDLADDCPVNVIRSTQPRGSLLGSGFRVGASTQAPDGQQVAAPTA